MTRTIFVAGGVSGVGLEIGRAILGAGEDLVLTGPDAGEAKRVAASLGDRAMGIALDLSTPEHVAEQLAGVPPLNGIILTSDSDEPNPIEALSIERACGTVTRRLVGYPAVISALLDRLEASEASAIVLFGGSGRTAPAPGFLLDSAADAGVEGLVASLAAELAPVRVNGFHHGALGTSADAHPAVSDAVKAVGFLMGNRGMSGGNVHFGLVRHVR